MTSYLDKLNLSPQERRLVVGVAIVVFIVLNLWLVVPYFGELGRIEVRMHDQGVALQKYKAEITKRSLYEKQRAELEKTGQPIAPEEQDVKLTREVNDMATLSGVGVGNSTLGASGSGGRTNIFFQEKAVMLNFQNTGEKELVDFLNSLGAANTLIRVKNMNLRPEQGRMKLGGQLTLVKSFQRKQPAKTPGPPVAAKPTATTPTPTPATAKPTTTLPVSKPPAASVPKKPEIKPTGAHPPSGPGTVRPTPTPIGRPTNNAAKNGPAKK